MKTNYLILSLSIIILIMFCFGLYFYFTTPLSNTPEENEQLRLEQEQMIEIIKEEPQTIFINKEELIRQNINFLKNEYKGDNLILSPLGYYYGIFYFENLKENPNFNPELKIFGNSKEEIDMSMSLLLDKINNSDKDDVKIINTIYSPKLNEKEIKEKYPHLFYKNVNTNIFQIVNNEINTFYLNQSNDVLKNYINKDFKFKNWPITSSIFFNNRWSNEYYKLNEQEESFFGTNSTSLSKFLYSPVEKYYENEEFIGIEKEYISGTYSFKAILYKNDFITFDETVKKININKVIDLFNKEIPQENFKTFTKIPEFKIQTPIEYNSNYNNSEYNIFQKINFNFNRYGSLLKKPNKNSEVLIADKTDNIKEITLNRPFIFFIWNNELDIPIMSGILSNIQ